MRLVRLNVTSGKVYGVTDVGEVLVADMGRCEGDLCDIDAKALDWRVVTPGKVPVTLTRWIESLPEFL